MIKIGTPVSVKGIAARIIDYPENGLIEAVSFDGLMHFWTAEENYTVLEEIKLEAPKKRAKK